MPGAEGDTTPIMFITAFANECFWTQVMQAGAVSFLFKPFTATALIDGLQQALGKWKPTVHRARGCVPMAVESYCSKGNGALSMEIWSK